MTMYVISGALADGQIHLDDMVTISEDAWKTGGSRMFVQVGTQVPVKDLIDGIIVASGNDACVAMSEHVGGTAENFVDIMNHTAQQLGMKDTHFTDATGLPDPNHYSTPYDLALLARAIIHNYPEDYSLYKQQSVSWNNITQANRNRLLWLDPSVDGLKTGHTNDAGYCLVASAKREDMRLISVVMGAPSVKARTQDSQALLTYGFRFYKTQKLANAKERLLEEKVWYGKLDKTAIGPASDLYVTAQRNDFDQIKTEAEINKPLNAPLQQGQVVGKLVAALNGKVLAETDLIALKENPKAGIFSRAWDRFKLFFHRTET
jgi:D-alanyl-D-alanine carboxypeptidase (penicillin-binding protein 5/6)